MGEHSSSGRNVVLARKPPLPPRQIQRKDHAGSHSDRLNHSTLSVRKLIQPKRIVCYLDKIVCYLQALKVGSIRSKLP